MSTFIERLHPGTDSLRLAFLKPLLFLLCIVGAEPSHAAGIALNGSILSVTTDKISVTFDRMRIQSLTNLITGEKYISSAGPDWLDLDLKEPTGENLQTDSWHIVAESESRSDIGQILAHDAERTVRLTVGIDADTQEVFFRLEGYSNKPGVRSLFYGLRGFDPVQSKFLFPGQAGIYFDARSDPSVLGLQYPTHWGSQFAVYQKTDGGILLYARDEKHTFKRVIASREFGTLDIGVEVFSYAPWNMAVEVPVVEWRMRAYGGDWRVPADYYRHWHEGISPSRKSANELAWTHDIKNVITVINPEIPILETLAERLIPAKTLIYLVNWRKDAFDVNYPDYTPSADSGPFVRRAHELGFRVMLHVNALGVATYNPAYERVQQYQIRDPNTEELLYWPWGLWPGGSPPPGYIQSFAFISPASSEYRSLFIDSIRPAVDLLEPDALHLDAGGVMLNDGNGLFEGITSIEGMQRLSLDVVSAYPRLALGFESISEVIAPFYSFAQRWKSDFPAHPIDTFLFENRVMMYGFLDQPNPDEPGFIDYIRRYEAQGVMPTLQVRSLDDLDEDLPVTSRILRLMKLWQEHDFRPDWDGDWSGLLFRYESADGLTRATVENSENSIRLKAGEELIYERVKNANLYLTDASILDWPAFDNTIIYGLNPEEEYWLTQNAPQSENRIRLSRLPVGVMLGSNSIAAPDYACFELENLLPSPYDFSRGFSEAKRGIIYNGKEYTLGYGALTETTQTLINGELKTPVILMQPPRILGAVVYLDYLVDIPGSDSFTHLLFSAGLSDFGTRSDGALFVVRIDDDEVWRKKIELNQLLRGDIDLTRWAGRRVRIRFIVHPGDRLNPVMDWGCWADLRMQSELRNDAISLTVSLPYPSTEASIGGYDWPYPAQPDQPIPATSKLPGRFLVFARRPPQIRLGNSLLDYRYDVWRAGYGGLPQLSRFEYSGQIRDITSRGVRVDRALATIPPNRGMTLISWGIRLPQRAQKLQFRVGLADAPPPFPAIVNYSEAIVSIRINGTEVWSKILKTSGWSDETVDLSAWQGTNTVLELVADSSVNALFDFVHWADLTISESGMNNPSRIDPASPRPQRDRTQNRIAAETIDIRESRGK